MKYLFMIWICLGAMACISDHQAGKSSEAPTNIIFLIGDGMGLSAVSTTIYYGDKVSSFSQFDEFGYIITSSATHKVTDSAASGTAMATGTKTYNGAIGMDTSRVSVENIVEVVSALGWSTGVLATSSVTHATPASFFAHVKQRGMEQDIAAQLLESEVDFFAGGGIKFFNKRLDGADLIQIAGEKGFIMDTTSLAEPGSLSPDHKYGFLLADGGMPARTEGREDFLPNATALALDHLSANKNGFFLMVEGSQIDWAAHDNDEDRLIAEMLDFEKTIDVALDFARKDGNTLVVVTADHETGGFALSASTNEATGGSDYRQIGPTFATSGHSTTLIPIFAYGPGSEAYKGIFENTEIFHKMKDSVLPAE